MTVKKTIVEEVTLTPKEVATVIAEMWDSEQAEMFGHLLDIFEGNHNLMMQFLGVRDKCNKKQLEAFQSIGAAAFRYWEL